MNKQGSKATQKENETSPENKRKNMEICDLNGRIQDGSSEKKKRCKKIQILNVMSPENKSRIKTNTLPNSLKL